jgi:hypothetical protein
MDRTPRGKPPLSRDSRCEPMCREPRRPLRLGPLPLELVQDPQGDRAGLGQGVGVYQ